MTTTFNITVDNPAGEDTAWLFPGTLEQVRITNGITSGAIYLAYTGNAPGGAAQSRLVEFGGTPMAHGTPGGGTPYDIAGNATSLRVFDDLGGPFALQINITLDPDLAGYYGVPMYSFYSLTLDALVNAAQPYGPVAVSLSGSTGGDILRGSAIGDGFAGGGGNDVLIGGGGNDFLNGGTGNDRMIGGRGNDTYIVDSSRDVVDEGEYNAIGNDTVRAGVSFSMNTGTRLFGTIENLVMTGAGGFSAVGNALANTITGNAGNNTISGGGGGDMVDGRFGNDRLGGGTASDLLTGGPGNDVFVYRLSADSRGSAVDRVSDFDDSGNDRIDLSAIFRGSLDFVGTRAFRGAGEVRISDVSGPDVIVQVNTAGASGPELSIRLRATSAADMSASDFVL